MLRIRLMVKCCSPVSGGSATELSATDAWLEPLFGHRTAKLLNFAMNTAF